MALVSLTSSSTNRLLPSSSPPSIRRGPPAAGNGALALAAAPAGRRGVVQWRAPVSLSSFSSFLPSLFKNKEKEGEEKAARLKEELLAAIAPLDRGAEATPEDKDRVDQIARRLEEARPAKEPLKSDLLNGKWELLYTTSTSILQPQVLFPSASYPNNVEAPILCGVDCLSKTQNSIFLMQTVANFH